MSKKRGNEKEKNTSPYHKEFGLWDNLKYIMRRAVHYEKGFLWLIPLGMITVPVMQYLWSFISKFVIDMITGTGEVQELFGLMLGCTIVQVVFTVLNTTYENEFWWRCISVRLSLMNDEKNAKAMQIAYEYLEDADVMDCYNKAGQACNNNMNGVEGLLRCLLRFLCSCTVVICGLYILGSMNPWIMLSMLFFAGIIFLISNHTTKTTKEVIWDRLQTWWRKNYYMQHMTTDFDCAKDIRMFHLKDWLLGKYRELHKERNQAEKKNAAYWLTSDVISNVCCFLSQGIVYAWLISSVAKGTMTIGNFSLYLATTESLFEYMNTLFLGVRDLLARSREVDDFRSFI